MHCRCISTPSPSPPSKLALDSDKLGNTLPSRAGQSGTTCAGYVTFKGWAKGGREHVHPNYPKRHDMPCLVYNSSAQTRAPIGGAAFSTTPREIHTNWVHAGYVTKSYHTGRPIKGICEPTTRTRTERSNKRKYKPGYARTADGGSTGSESGPSRDAVAVVGDAGASSGSGIWISSCRSTVSHSPQYTQSDQPDIPSYTPSAAAAQSWGG